MSSQPHVGITDHPYRVLCPWGGFWIVQTPLSDLAHIAYDPPDSPHWKNEAYFPTKQAARGFLICLAQAVEEDEKHDLYLIGKHRVYYTRRPKLKNPQRLIDSGYAKKERGLDIRLAGYGEAIYESLDYMVQTGQWTEP